MPNWNLSYYQSIKDKLKEINKDLDIRLRSIVNGRTVPNIDDIPIGSAKKLNAAILFFDIAGSSRLDQFTALYTLNVVVPILMKIIHDHGGYVEKNTGDGVMAIFTAMDEKAVCKAALESGMNAFCILKTLINPHMISIGIQPVDGRIGIDFGEILVSRIGVPQGSSKQARSFMTAVGPAANIACRLQEQAGINEIWAGNAVFGRAPIEWHSDFNQVFPENWSWVVLGTTDQPYPAWRFNQQRNVPPSGLLGLGLPLPPPARPAPTGLINQPSPSRGLFDLLDRR